MAAEAADAYDTLLATIWSTWTSLGVRGWAREGAGAVVDPEALIVLTITMGDLRLEHETVDWAIEHAHLLSVARLRALARRAAVRDEVERWIAAVAASTTRVRWRWAPGIEPSDVTPSGASRPYDEADPGAATTVLRLRALTGPTVRSDVVRALHRVARGQVDAMSTAQIAWNAAGTTPGVLAALRDLEQAGIVRQLGSNKRRRYEPGSDTPIARAIWEIWCGAPFAPWVDAVSAVPALLEMRRAGRDEAAADAEQVERALDALDGDRDTIGALTGLTFARQVRGSVAQVARELGDMADDGLRAAAVSLRVGN